MMVVMNRSTQIRALASDQRLKILNLLAEPGKNFGHQWSADPVEFGVCMTMIADAIGVTQPTASRHLDLLRQADFLTVRRHQKWSYCQRNKGAIEDCLNWLRGEIGVAAADI